MSKARIVAGLVAGCLVLGSTVPAWAQQPRPEQILQFTPKQKDIACTTPPKEEYSACKVDLVQGAIKGSNGWLLLDAKRQPLRRFFDSNGDRKIDAWSYFKDGVEVYREIDTNFNEKPDQYRWLNTGGMKWGVDKNEDGKIDYWVMVSAEEAAQEVFAAITTQNFERLRALLINEQELRGLKLPAAQLERIRNNVQTQVAKKWSEVLKVPSLEGAQFERVESAVPHLLPAEGAGNEDVLRFPSRAILYQTADKKHDWINSGQMIQVGMAWRLVDGPGTQEIPSDDTNPTRPPPPPPNKVLEKLLDELTKLDTNPPMPPSASAAAIMAYNQQRVALLEKIMPHDTKEMQESWAKQMFDNLQSWAIAEFPQTTALKLMAQKKTQIIQTMPNLAPYAAFRELWATYSPALEGRDPKADMRKIQEKWMDELSKFVQAHPKAEDTPEALNHLALGCEFGGQDEQAKRWYQQLYTNFPDHHMAEKAKGSERRLSLVGRELELVGPTLLDKQSFNISSLKGKVVLVYYWASYCDACVRDFNTIKKIQETNAAKGFELVCVNLDDRREIAIGYLQKTPVNGAHLYEVPPGDGGGLNSPLATQYGISGLPTLFLIGRDGRVVNRTLHINDLEDAIKKAL